MSYVSARDHTDPEPPHHLRACEIPPAPLDMALIFTFIEDNRLRIVSLPLRRLLELIVLQAPMRYPWFRIIVKLFAVVNRAQVPVRIAFFDYPEEIIPFRLLPGLYQIVFVCDR